jgi:hypothetical protein
VAGPSFERLAPSAACPGYVAVMGLFDDLRKSLAKSLASNASEQAVRSAEKKATALAEDFTSTAEKHLADAQGAREGRLEALEKAAAGAREERKQRLARAQEELARLKAEAASKEAALEDMPPSDTPAKRDL